MLAGGVLGLIAGLLITSPPFVDAFSTRIEALGLIPVLTIFTPFQNQTVSGTVPFFVQADSSGIVSLLFKIDGQDFGTAITAGSCRAIWNSGGTGDGLHTIQAEGLDQFGNTTISQPVSVLVNNSVPPPPPAPGPPPTPGPTPAPAPTPAPSPSPEPELRITQPLAGSRVSAIFEAAVLATEISPSSVRLEIRQPQGQLVTTATHSNSNLLVFSAVLSTLENGPYDLVAVSETVSSPPVRVNFVRSLLLPRPRPEPIGGSTPEPETPLPVRSPKPGFVLSLQTAGGSQFSLTSILQKNGLVVPGALVTFVVTGPGGSRVTYRAITDSAGVATARGQLRVGERRGIYRVFATAAATHGWALVSATGSFVN
jgi:hypothetical protein